MRDCPGADIDRLKEPIAGLTAFIIGLPSNYRGQTLEKQLSSEGVVWNRCDGVIFDPEAHSSNLLDIHGAKILLRRAMLRSEVGCALAHRNVYFQMVEDSIQTSLIFEDDARLIRSVPQHELHQQLQTAVPRVILLSYKMDTAIAYRRQQAEPNTDGLFRAIVPPTTTTAYALNLAAARVLIDDGRPISHVADWPVRASTRIEYYFERQPVAAPDTAAVTTVGDRGSSAATLTTRSKLNRRISSISHLTWWKNRDLYGSYHTYLLHEFVRMPSFWKARKRLINEQRNNSQPPYTSGRLVDAIGYLWR